MMIRILNEVLGNSTDALKYEQEAPFKPLLYISTTMKVQEQIKSHLASLSEPKRSEMNELHQFILQTLPGCKQWFDNGLDETGRTMTNPTIGYGEQTLQYANGKTRDFFQIGLSANSTGISVYILGIKDKSYLKNTYSKLMGKASITGYCIKFKTIQQIDMTILGSAIQDGVKLTSKN